MATPKGLGWKRQLPDQRDYKLAGMRVLPPPKALPPKFSLLSSFPGIRDQGALGSCTAFAGSYAFGIAAKEAKQGTFVGFPWNGGSKGDVPMPGPGERALGGHALCIIGYDDKLSRWEFPNSWSTSWGSLGYGTLPYGYLTDPGLSADFWALEVVSGPTPTPQPGPKKVTHTIAVFSDGSVEVK